MALINHPVKQPGREVQDWRGYFVYATTTNSNAARRKINRKNNPIFKPFDYNAGCGPFATVSPSLVCPVAFRTQICGSCIAASETGRSGISATVHYRTTDIAKLSCFVFNKGRNMVLKGDTGCPLLKLTDIPRGGHACPQGTVYMRLKSIKPTNLCKMLQKTILNPILLQN